MIVFITPLILYLLCIVALKKLIPFLTRMSLVDYPTKRSNHFSLIPKGAGILIVPLLIFSISIIFFLKKHSKYTMDNLCVVISYFIFCFSY